jgi:hypothetical protein
VRTYGSDQRDGIDAIQLELGTNLRRDAGLIDDLAAAIVAYFKAYLVAGNRGP